MRIKREQRRTPVLLKILIVLFVVTGMSLALAYVWQHAQDSLVADVAADSGRESSALEDELSAGNPSEEEETGGLSGLEEEEKPVSNEPAPSETEENEPVDGDTYAREAVDGAVPLSETVGYSYFEDALFFGDSISTGIPLYMKTAVPNAAVIAMSGINPDSINSSECIEVDGVRVTMLEAAKTKGVRGKIYIMLGANGLEMQQTAFIDGYRTFIKSVKEQFPGAVIYIQSILPVTSEVGRTYEQPEVNNSRIEQFNAEILALSKELRVNYVDVAQAVVNEDGFLPLEASPLDGMHLTPEYYIKWFDYLRSHTV